MTAKKFKRLFIVLLGPLLVAGIICGVIAHQDMGSMNLYCHPFLKVDHCRDAGWKDNKFEEMIRRESPTWFYVQDRSYDENKFPRTSVQASQRIINDVQILEVAPYIGTSDLALSDLRALSGSRMSIIFGALNGEAGNRMRSLYPLQCNELRYVEGASNVFWAGLCGVPNGVAQVKFSIGSLGSQQLLDLKAAIDKETAERRQEIIRIYLIATPLFVVLFLLFSGVIWIIRHAILYVLKADSPKTSKENQ